MSNFPLAEKTGNSRVKRPPQADEPTTVLAFLQWHRETLALKCTGLTPAQLAAQAVGTSALSLLGLMRHAAESERFWFRRVMAGADLSPLFSPASTPGDAFDVANADAAMVEEAETRGGKRSRSQIALSPQRRTSMSLATNLEKDLFPCAGC